MKHSKIKLSIEKPCSQDWNSMTVNEQGKFCDHCAKSVIDFTGLSDEEAIQLISANPGKICGRVKPSQMNRILEAEPSTSIISPYKFAAGLFIAASSHSFAASAVEVRMETVEHKFDEKADHPDVLKDSLISVVEGIVLDQEGEPLVGAVIRILDSKLGAVTDMDGKFKFVLPDTFDLNVIVLHPEFVDATGEDVIIDRRKPAFVAEIHMNVETDISEIGFVVYKPKKWWQFWK